MPEWIQEIRGIPSIDTYKLFNNTKLQLTRSNYLNNQSHTDKLITNTESLKESTKQICDIIEKNDSGKPSIAERVASSIQSLLDIV